MLPEGSSRRRRSCSFSPPLDYFLQQAEALSLSPLSLSDDAATTEPAPAVAPTPSTSRRGYAYEPILESDPAEKDVQTTTKTPGPAQSASNKTPAPRRGSTKEKEVVEADSGRSARKSTAAARETVAPTPKPRVRPPPKSVKAEEPAVPSKGKEKAVDEGKTAAVVDGPPAQDESALEEPASAQEEAAPEATADAGLSVAPVIDAETKDGVEGAKKDGPLRRKALQRKGADRQAFIEWATRVDALEDKVAINEDTELFDGESSRDPRRAPSLTSSATGLLVWARTSGHWPFPAEVADPNHEDTPIALIEAKPPHAERDGLIPVRF